MGNHLTMAFFRAIFSSFGSLREPLPEHESQRLGPETVPLKMDLEERMVFRRELLFEAIQGTMSQLNIDPGSYRGKVMRTDKRGHRYVVMLDMSLAYMSSDAGQHPQLADTALTLTQNAYSRYGLVVGGVYWRTDSTLDAVVADWAQRSHPTAAVAADGQEDPLERRRHASAEEFAAFEAAWRHKSAVRIGEHTYSTDRLPLDSHRTGD